MNSSSFSSLSLPKALVDNLTSLEYTQMTPIQAASLPLSLDGKDVIAQARTGSGKTAAFGIPMLCKLNPRNFGTQALILSPTRELCTQIATELRRIARYQQNIKIVVLTGGQPIGPQIGSLEHGAHIVVGTPGRIQDHLRKETLNLEQVHTVVLDEADRMLDMGFIEPINDIIAHTPEERQTQLFSATYPEGIQGLSANIQRDPQFVQVETTQSHQKITQLFYQVKRNERQEGLCRLLAEHQPQSCVVFCNTKQQCRDLSEYLQDQGHSAVALHGDMEQRERDLTLVQFSNNSCSILVATDVAARGLDIKDLEAVCNYEMSRQTEVYVHRIGRTGRAGKEGLALNLVTESEQYKLDDLADYLDEEIHCMPIDSLPAVYGPSVEPPMITLMISGGRRDKVRPGDVLGALTGEAGIPGSAVGKIDLNNFNTFVAIERDMAKKALGRLLNGKIKGRKFKVRML